MVEHGLTRLKIAASVDKARTAIRQGTERLVRGCRDTKTPLVVVSAGITDVIDALMVAHVGVDLWPDRSARDEEEAGAAPAVVVHANSGVYSSGKEKDGGGRLIGFSPEKPIHWLNKILTTRPLSTSLEFGSKVIVLLGDSVKDVAMVNTTPGTGLAEADQPLAVINIGLLNTTQDSNSEELEEHMEVFDAVIAGDGPLDFAIDEVLAMLWGGGRSSGVTGDGAKL